MVLLCHLAFASGIGTSAGAAQTFAFNLSASGVWLFFVLSGYLIGGILLDHRGAGHYFRAFYGRRACRIFPVYYGFLAFTLLSGLLLHRSHKPTPVFDAGTPFVMFLFFVQNFGLAWWSDWGWITVTMTWSLALEEQFYLTLPAAVRFIRAKSLVVFGCTLLAVAPLARYFLSAQPHQIGALVLVALQLDALFAGFLCAVLVRKRKPISSRTLILGALVSAGMVVACNLPGSRILFLQETSLSGLYVCVLLLAVQGRIAPLRWPVLCFFGTISYSLYLIHQTALVAMRSLLLRWAPSGWQAVGAPCLAAVVSIAIAKLSWDFFEGPLTSWAHRRFRYGPIVRAGKTSSTARESSELQGPPAAGRYADKAVSPLGL